MGPSSVGNFVRVDLAGGLLAVCVLTLVDVVGVTQRPPQPSPGGVIVSALAGLCLGTLLAAIVLVPRGMLARRLRARVAGGAVIAGVADALGLLALAVYLQDPRVLATADLRMFVTVGAILGGGLVGWGWDRLFDARPMRECLVAGCIALTALWSMTQLRWNGDPWFRLALHVALAVAVTRSVLPWLLRGAARWRVVMSVGIALGCVGVLAWWVLLPGSSQARLALYHRSSHARTWAYAVERATGQGASGGAHPRGTVVSAPSPTRTGRALHGAAEGSDVLLFSVDSLRWDTIEELRPLRDALGHHVQFSLAVSPAPATRQSLGATLRGREVHQLVFESAPGSRGEILWRDPSPTLGHVLARAGYRAVTVPTSNQSDPRLGIQSGFDTVWTVNHGTAFGPRMRSPFRLSYTPVHELVPVLHAIARDTPGPLLLWTHFMEPHYSYHWSPTEEGPRGVAAYRRAVRYEAEQLAQLVRDFREIRRRPAIVAIFGDHGEEFGEHGGNYHGTTVHAEQVRVAFLLAGPGIEAGTVSAPVSIAALPATVLDLLGIAAPPSMTIRSLVGPLAGDEPWPAHAVSELRSDYREAVGYTTHAWRLVRDARHDIDQLFDAVRDPSEQRDLARQRPDDLALMRQLAAGSTAARPRAGLARNWRDALTRPVDRLSSRPLRP